MESPPLDPEEFIKWKQAKIRQPIIKECDMNNEMREESQEMIISGIDKCTG